MTSAKSLDPEFGFTFGLCPNNNFFIDEDKRTARD